MVASRASFCFVFCCGFFVGVDASAGVFGHAGVVVTDPEPGRRAFTDVEGTQWFAGCTRSTPDPHEGTTGNVGAVTGDVNLVTLDTAGARRWVVGTLQTNPLLPFDIVAQSSDCSPARADQFSDGLRTPFVRLYTVSALNQRPSGGSVGGVPFFDTPFQLCVNVGRLPETALACFDMAQDPPLRTDWLAGDDLEAALAPPADPAGFHRDGFTRDLSIFVHGDLFSRVSLQLRPDVGQGGFSIRWMVQQHPDGSVDVLDGPLVVSAVDAANPAPLMHALQVTWHAGTDSVVVAPVPAQQLERSEGEGIPGRYRGTGIALYGLSSPGLVSLNLTEIVDDAARDTVLLMGDGFGDVFVNDGVIAAAARVVDIDADAADLDGDGVVGADDDNDFDADFDGGGVNDGFEEFYDGTDAGDADDDDVRLPSLPPDFDRFLAYNELLQHRLPIRTLDVVTYPTPYVCGEGRCFDAAGAEVFAAPVADTEALMTPDGDAVVWRDEFSFQRRDLQSGVDVEGPRHVALRAALGGDPQAITPAVDGGLYAVGADRVVHAGFDGAAPVVVFDAVVESAADANAGVFGALQFAGYDPGRDAVFVIVEGAADVRLAVVSATRPPFVALASRDFLRQGVDLGNGTRFAGGILPEQVVTTENDGYAVGLSGALDARHQFHIAGALYDDSFRNNVAIAPFGVVPGAMAGGWSGSLFTQNGQPPASFIYELSSSPLVIEPGDVVGWSLDRDAEALGPIRVPPRGGDVPVLPNPWAGHDVGPTFLPFWISASADGRLCAVYNDGVSDRVGELVDPDDHGLPSAKVEFDGVFDARACAYDDDGALFFVGAAPPALTNVETGAVIELPLQQPHGLVANPAGGFVVVGNDDEFLACVDASGAVTRSTIPAVAATFSRNGSLYVISGVFGELVRLDPDARGDPCSDASPVTTSTYTTRALLANEGIDNADATVAVLAERPDGLFALFVPGFREPTGAFFDYKPRIHFIDRNDGSFGRLSLTPMSAMARVPGGTWCDPWEDLLPPDPRRCDLPDGPGEGEGEEGEGDGGEGEGAGGGAVACCAAAGDVDVVAGVVCCVFLLRRRRR